MSGSDATEPATDDFESRFWEIDDYSADESINSFSEESISCRNSHLSASSFSENKRSIVNKPSLKSGRQPRLSQKRQQQLEEDEIYDIEVPANCSMETPGIVRTRQGYQTSQSSLWSLEDITGGQNENISALTPEQLEARQRRIIRRRETAKNKAELEKKQTVEKLLRVNTDFMGSIGRGRGRGRKSKLAETCDPSSSDSDESNDREANYDCANTAPKTGLYSLGLLDPPNGFVRVVSSTRLSPCVALILPPDMDITSIFPSSSLPHHPKFKMCEQCHGQPRRYACPKTGASLCSLRCFKALSSVRPSPNQLSRDFTY